MNTKLLKQKILDLAIRGKLTQQLKSDGTAADLLKEISDAKSALSQPKGKKSKDPEQIIPLDKNEAPFEIPENWEWVCIDSIASLITDGEHLTPRRVESFEGYYLLSARNIQDNEILLNDVDYVDEDEYNRIAKRCNPRKNDVLISCSGSIGRVTVVRDDNKYVMVRSAAMIRPVFVHSCYLMYVLQSNCLQSQIQNYSKQTAQANLFQAAIRALQFPLPPLAEQQRIVAKIEEAFAEIDAIEKNKELLKTHIKQTRQKILDLAIHGKLVPQNKSDEPASVLLERITRDNPHYEKLEDEPFEIPQNWVWCKLGNLFFHTTGKALKKANSTGIQRNYITTSNLYWCEFDLSEVRSMYFTEDELDKCTAKKGDLLLCNGGDVGRAAIWNFDYDICFQNHISRLRPKSVSLSNVFYLYVIRYNKEKGNLNGRGVGITSLSANDLLSLVVPLPPLAEQSRIVAKIEELFSTLGQMERNLV